MDIETLNRRTWEEMVYASMRANYFGDLVNNYRNWDRGCRVATLVLTSGAAVTAMLPFDQHIRASVSIVAAILSAWQLFSQYSTMSRDAAELTSSWQILVTRYEKLWNNLTDPQAEQIFDQIYADGDKLSVPGCKFPQTGRRLNRWMDHAETILTARYSQAASA